MKPGNIVKIRKDTENTVFMRLENRGYRFVQSPCSLKWIIILTIEMRPLSKTMALQSLSLKNG